MDRFHAPLGGSLQIPCMKALKFSGRASTTWPTARICSGSFSLNYVGQWTGLTLFQDVYCIVSLETLSLPPSMLIYHDLSRHFSPVPENNERVPGCTIHFLLLLNQTKISTDANTLVPDSLSLCFPHQHVTFLYQEPVLASKACTYRRISVHSVSLGSSQLAAAYEAST